MPKPVVLKRKQHRLGCTPLTHSRHSRTHALTSLTHSRTHATHALTPLTHSRTQAPLTHSRNFSSNPFPRGLLTYALHQTHKVTFTYTATPSIQHDMRLIVHSVARKRQMSVGQVARISHTPRVRKALISTLNDTSISDPVDHARKMLMYATR